MDHAINNLEHIPGANVPPPPSEVGVRTMASDLASIAQSGGGAPKPIPLRIYSRTQENARNVAAEAQRSAPPPAPMIAVNQNMPGAAASADVSQTQSPAGKQESFFSKPIFLFGLLGLLLAGTFSAAYFLVYPLLNPKQPVVKQPLIPVPAQTTSFEHKSVFGQAVDGNFNLEILSPVNGMQFKRDKIASFINAVPGSFYEIVPEVAGQPFTADDFFSSVGANVLGSDFLNANFEKDFTLFLYKDKDGLWPGYILQVKAGKSPIFLQKEVLQKMQSAATERANLFLVAPGTPFNSQFQTGLSSGQPVWFLNFPNVSSSVAYGWLFNKYLAISTSLDGMKQAILHF